MEEIVDVPKREGTVAKISTGPKLEWNFNQGVLTTRWRLITLARGKNSQVLYMVNAIKVNPAYPTKSWTILAWLAELSVPNLFVLSFLSILLKSIK